MMLVDIKYRENTTKKEKDNLYGEVIRKYGKRLQFEREHAIVAGATIGLVVGAAASIFTGFYYHGHEQAGSFIHVLGVMGVVGGVMVGPGLSLIAQRIYKTRLKNRISEEMGLEVKLKDV